MGHLLQIFSLYQARRRRLLCPLSGDVALTIKVCTALGSMSDVKEVYACLRWLCAAYHSPRCTLTVVFILSTPPLAHLAHPLTPHSFLFSN